MAPEVIKQTGHSFPADVWCVGCVLTLSLTLTLTLSLTLPLTLPLTPNQVGGLRARRDAHRQA